MMRTVSGIAIQRLQKMSFEIPSYYLERFERRRPFYIALEKRLAPFLAIEEEYEAEAIK